MMDKSARILLYACVLLLVPTALWSQEAAPVVEGEEEIPEASHSVKKIALSFYGGYFSGATFLDLPPTEDRTQVEEGSDDVYRYDDGTAFELPEHYDAPRKTIEPGWTMGARIGFYLSEQFHLDLSASYSLAKATTTFLNSDPSLPLTPIREQLDQDPDFSVIMGGFNLMYDITTVHLLGFSPFFGVGMGGILNSFSVLDDKGALYFQFVGGLSYYASSALRIDLQIMATTFSFDREELSYGKQATYANATIGFSWMLDTTPDM